MLDFQTNEYEVCMQELMLTVGGWDNVRDGTNTMILKGNFGSPLLLSIEPGHYPTIESLVKEFNKELSLENNRYRPSRTGNDEYDLKLAAMVGYGGYFYYDETAKTLEFKIHEHEPLGKSTETTIKFCKEFAYMLGIISNINMPVPIIKLGHKFDLSKIDMYRNTLTILWVFADFIDPTIVGPYLAPILRMVPIQLSSGNLEHQMFGLQYYLPVKRMHLQHFRIQIKEILNGPNIRIRGNVIIPLHFRIKE